MIEDRDPVAHRERFFLVVRDVYEGDADLALHVLQLKLHFLAKFQVKGAERLVEQQDLRLVDDRPGERDALALAAGQLCGLALAEAGKPYHLQCLAGFFPARWLRHSPDAQAVLDILGNRHVREQSVILEYRIDVARVRRHPGHDVPGEFNLARIRLLKTGDEAQ